MKKTALYPKPSVKKKISGEFWFTLPLKGYRNKNKHLSGRVVTNIGNPLGHPV